MKLGHVGDPDRIVVEATPQGPHFDQAHVDYLKKVFPALGGIAATTLDEMVAASHGVAFENGRAVVINHIQSLVDQFKKAPR